MKKVLKRSVVFIVVLTMVVVTVNPAWAAKVATKKAGEFGTLKGELYDACVDTSTGWYEFSYETSITNRIYSGTTVRATIEICNYLTGKKLDGEMTSCVGTTRAGYYFQLDHFQNYKITKYKVYGAHEVVPPKAATGSKAYGVYTSNTYDYRTDSRK